MEVIETKGRDAFRRASERMAELEAERKDIEEQIQMIRFEACRMREETLSAEVMTQTFRQFRDVVEAAEPEQLK